MCEAESDLGVVRDNFGGSGGGCSTVWREASDGMSLPLGVCRGGSGGVVTMFTNGLDGTALLTSIGRKPVVWWGGGEEEEEDHSIGW